MILFNNQIHPINVEGEFEFPLYPATVTEFPHKLITFEEARQELKKDNPDLDAFVCFYKDDQKFDSPTSGIWHHPERWLPLLKPFKGVIEPDFSTYQDFPMVLKQYNTYRMRVMGYLLYKNHIPVISNYRSGTPETYHFVTDGIPRHSLVSIGTHGVVKDKTNIPRLCNGVHLLIHKKEPKGILIYGSLPKELKSLLESYQIPYHVYETDLMRRLGKHHV